MPLPFRTTATPAGIQEIPMKAFWWQGGVHIQPETTSELAALNGLMKTLEVVQAGEGVSSDGPLPYRLVNDSGDQDSVVGIDKPGDVLKQG